MKHLTNWKRQCAAALIWAVMSTVSMPAQSGAATLSGNVVDQVGKAIEGATVTAKLAGGLVSGTATTDANGHFTVTNLTAGTYSLEVSSRGFARNTRMGVPVGSGASPEVSITLNVDAISQSVTVQETSLVAADLAPQGNILDATSARTEISSAVIQNFMAPVADFAEVIQQAPGAFSTNPNGIGLGQGKSYFRGFSDGQYTLTFDGIPFEDTNTPTHHSWASFPSQWISSVDFDRSPGQASNFGPTNFGGSINLKSPELQADPDIRGTMTVASFNTRLYSLDAESGLLGHRKQDAVLFNINAMTSDGYQTFNHQQRDAGYGKYQHRFSDRTSLSLYGGVVDIWNNTPNTTNPTRAQVAQFGDNYLLDGTALMPNGTPDPYYYKLRQLSRADRFRVCRVYLGPGQRLEVRHESIYDALLEQAVLSERRNRYPDERQAERRGQAERLPARRRHAGGEQGNQMGHLPHGHVVRLGVHRPLSGSFEYPDAARILRCRTSTSTSSRRVRSRSRSLSGARRRGW